MMNRLPLILLFITLGACAPENDPTSQYDTAKYVALKEQALDKQYYLPNNAINLQVAMTPKWQKAASNEITVTFYSNIEG
ncbi:MAG: hypothetical protein KDD40_08845, partial [Bdellovibrionales bacterium]|nr:hypothetical protein [Bdellovibrionales bacterium]